MKIRAYVIIIAMLTIPLTSVIAEEIQLNYGEEGKVLYVNFPFDPESQFHKKVESAQSAIDVVEEYKKYYEYRKGIYFGGVSFYTADIFYVNGGSSRMMAFGDKQDLLNGAVNLNQLYTRGAEKILIDGVLPLTAFDESDEAPTLADYLGGLSENDIPQLSLCGLDGQFCDVDGESAVLSSLIEGVCGVAHLGEYGCEDAGTQCVACCKNKASCCDKCSN